MKLNVWKVRELIAEKGKTISEIATAAKMPPTHLSKILNRGTCSLAVGGRIAAALDVMVRDIWIPE